MNDKNLTALYKEHSGKVSDKWTIYLGEYERLFSEYRSQAINLLEVGVQNGGSLEIWGKYFPNAVNLIGCDINPNCANLSYDDSRVTVLVGDVNSDEIEDQVVDKAPSFDVIIDDGSHTSSDIIKSFSRYFPYLKNGGIFVVEDLHCSYWQEFEGGLFDPLSAISFFKRLTDVVSHEHWGVDKKRSEVLKGFYDKYHIQINDDLLAHVHSIEFINSICVIRKSKPQKNILGERIVAGMEAEVMPVILEKKNSHNVALAQAGNNWSECKVPPDEAFTSLSALISEAEKQLKILSGELAGKESQLEILSSELVEKEGQLAVLSRQLTEIYQSSIWKLTHPLRIFGAALRKIMRITQEFFSALSLAGGFKFAFVKALKLWRQEGFKGIKRRYKFIATQPTGTATASERNDYQQWIGEFDSLTESSCTEIKDNIQTFDVKPLLSIIVPVYNANIAWLDEAIESVRGQLYENWELCIADDCSTDSAVRDYLQKTQSKDSRIKVVFRENNGHISAASNSALSIAEGQWVVLMDQDDLLSEQALYWVVKAINENPEGKLFYSDEDKINENGDRHNPYFKCDWNRSLFYSQNMICHLGVYNHEIVGSIGGFREGFEGSQDHDLALRFIEHVDDSAIIHIPRILYHWRVHPNSTAGGAEAKPYAAVAGEKAIQQHLERLNINAEVTSSRVGYRVDYALPKKMPLVSLIIPTRNGLELVRTCIESIINLTAYPNYEIILIDNGSDDPDSLAYFSEIEKKYSCVSVKRDDSPFNYSALNNAAVAQAKGEIIGLINNDIEVIEPGWLSEMVSIVLQPGVGAVGAKLLYPDDTVQHAGVVIGIGGVAGHIHLKCRPDEPGYFGRLNLISEFSAVTAACLLVKKADYQQVGGLNEVDLTVAFNDVDFCLKLKSSGLRNIWTPHALLYHHESATRGYEDNPEKVARFNREAAYMTRTWEKYIANDPCYSPNLSLNTSDFSLAWPPRLTTNGLINKKSL